MTMQPFNNNIFHHPFGMVMPERSYVSGDGYRFGFNGMEQDSEISGDGNSLDFGARIYSPRLGRWFSTDPLQQDYPSLSPYQFVANSPIICIDPDGKKIVVTLSDGSKVEYKPGIQPTNDDAFLAKVHEAVTYAMKADPEGTLWTDLSENSRTVNIIQTSETGNKVAYETPNIQGTVQKDASGNVIAGTAKLTKVESTIKWNPEYGAVTTDGGGQSPSSLLYHEGIHSLKTLSVSTAEEAKQLAEDRKKDNTKYGNLDDKEHSEIIPGEETRYLNNVNAYEQSLANKLNENRTDMVDYVPQQQSTRNDHRGTPTKASSVNSIPSSASGNAGTVPNMSERNNIQLPDNTGQGSSYGNRGY